MLRLLLGRAGSGKTDFVMNDIKRRMGSGESGMFLIVPEQYSHDAERRLCAVCGDGLSLYAETLSFTRLFSHVLSETGGASFRNLDKSGQILAMHRALESVASSLKVFGIKKMRTEILERLLDAITEFKSLNISPQTLESAAIKASNPLADKLRDLALIYSAYDALLQVHGGDAAERLMFLADSIYDSSVGNTGHIYFDGFIDFTALELRVIEELLRKKANITFCLTCDPDDKGEIFVVPLRTVSQLLRLANGNGVEVKQEVMGASSFGRAPELEFIERFLFCDAPPVYSEECTAVTVYAAPTCYVECEYAASKVLELVRGGYRWRDVAIMARDWDEYGSICENVFDKYGIPYFSGGKADILSKPPLMLIDSALEISTSGFEYMSVFKYLKSGLTGITADQIASLENYVLMWQIRGHLWTKEWIMPPSGYGRAKSDYEEVLKQLNSLRQKIAKPLLYLRDGIKGESSADVKLRALYAFLEDVKLPVNLVKKANEFRERGEKRLADEYSQLWDITTSAMEQMHSILEAKKMSAIEFRKLFTLALSQNDVGVIPISLDRTALGSMVMGRRRDLKCLIILGATDESLPTISKSSGALSDNERSLLRDLGTDIPAGLEERLHREMNLLYSTVTLPSKELVVIYSTNGGRRPSFIVKRLLDMFGLHEVILREDEYMNAAKIPYFELLQSKGDFVVQTARQSQGLSASAANRLYGDDFSLSATRVDSYYSCPYRHFLKSGLRLEPRKLAEFDAMAAGNFMHYILDGVFGEIKEGVGFKNVEEDTYQAITKKHIDNYVNDVLLNFEGKSKRFEYLFRRYQVDAVLVVRDMIEELKKSDFEPFDLELDMSELSKTERGFIDRVDGYESDGKLYLRVIDYKTRKKAYSFEMDDILHGIDMQMLIYLFVLENFGKKRYKKTIVPAGVLYVPARDVILNQPRNTPDDVIEKKRTSEMRRSGLVLNDLDVLEAMENGAEKRYLPVKTSKDGDITGDSLVSPESFSLLSRHVDSLMKAAKENIQSGDNACIPYYRSDSDNACNYCDFITVCGFDEEMGDKRRVVSKMKPDEVWDVLRAEDEVTGVVAEVVTEVVTEV